MTVQEELDTLQRLPGQAHLKRAMEVAASGDIRMVITPTGTGWGLLPYVDRAAKAMGLTCNLQWPCLCGNFGSAVNTCVCTPDDWDNYRPVTILEEAAIYVAIAEPTPWNEPIGCGETLEAVMQRAQKARERPLPPATLDNPCEALMKAAVRQLGLDEQAVAHMLLIARVIERLANAPRLHIAHLAEAIQYRPRQRISQ